MASTIKVDNVQNQPGTNIINKCSVTTTIGAGAGDTINVCGATVNIGRCGGTVALACGASQTGFGRTGTVDWDTANIKTATFTAVSGNGYFCNTSGGVFNITLPASPTAGDIVAFKDYASTFNAFNLTIDRNGKPLDGATSNKAISTSDTSMTLVYVDGTEGWKPVEEGTGYIGENFIVATGGTPCTGAICGDYKIHTFTGPGTFCVSSLATTAGNNAVAYMVVAGGGGSGVSAGGGGGAGGFREGTTSPIVPYTASPLVAPTGITVTASPYSITIGGGGGNPGSPNCGVPGSVSTFATITSAGGGGGAGYAGTGKNGLAGGSGGGGNGSNCAPLASGGAGDTPPTPIAQGTAGGTGANLTGGSYGGGGGGGATVAGTIFTQPAGPSGCGGAGAGTAINPSPTYGTPGPSAPLRYFAGGGSGAFSGPPSPVAANPGGVGGGGTGQGAPNAGAGAATVGTAYTGGGGGGGCSGKAGGDGIVIIRYKFQ